MAVRVADTGARGAGVNAVADGFDLMHADEVNAPDALAVTQVGGRMAFMVPAPALVPESQAGLFDPVHSVVALYPNVPAGGDVTGPYQSISRQDPSAGFSVPEYVHANGSEYLAVAA